MADEYKEWLARARSSLAISKNKPDDDIYYEDLCFHAQQAVEKALKGFIIFYAVEPERTHNLVSLIKELAKHIEIPTVINETAILTDYAVQTRYPGGYTPIVEAEYKNAITIAENCVDWIESKIRELSA